MRDKIFESKLDKALGINEEYGKNDYGYPDPTKAKQKDHISTAKKKATKGEHKPLDKATEYDQAKVHPEHFKNEDTRTDFDKKEPKKTSQSVDINPPEKLPKLPKNPKP